jgi:hypothetical protein
VLVSVRRRVPDVDADWYLRILAIADLDRKIGAASTILDTVHVPAYTADSPMKMCAAGRWDVDGAEAAIRGAVSAIADKCGRYPATDR